jgi:hypothetical protein
MAGDLVALKNTNGGFTDPGPGNWTISPGQVKPLPKRISPRIRDLISRGLLVAAAPNAVPPPKDPPAPPDPPEANASGGDDKPASEEPAGKKKKK